MKKPCAPLRLPAFRASGVAKWLKFIENTHCARHAGARIEERYVQP